MKLAASVSTALVIDIGTWSDPSPDPFSFVEIPCGEFLIGGSEMDRYVSAVELPRRPAAVTRRIAMGRSPVTVCEWSRFAPHTKLRVSGSCIPVVDITWDQANDYTKWLSDQTGKSCRLPTEVEWEYAARAGNDALFPSGRNRLSLNEANYLYDEMGEAVGRGYITPIGSYPPNPFGLFDMSGNVSEWTSSPWSTSPGALNEVSSRRFVIRGGAWDQLPRTMRCSFRDWALRTESYDNLGFRVVIDLDA